MSIVDRDASDYGYQRRNPPGVPAGNLPPAGKDSREWTAKERRAAAMAREARRVELEDAVAVAMATFTTDAEIARHVGISAPTVKKYRLEIERQIAARGLGEKRAHLVRACQLGMRQWGTKALDGDLAASREYRAWIDLLARLDGCYARPEADGAARVEIDVTLIEATVQSMIAENIAEAEALEAQIIALPSGHPQAS